MFLCLSNQFVFSCFSLNFCSSGDVFYLVTYSFIMCIVFLNLPIFEDCFSLKTLIMLSYKSIIFNMILEKIITYFVGYKKNALTIPQELCWRRVWVVTNETSLNFMALCLKVYIYVRKKKPQTQTGRSLVVYSCDTNLY